jgi:hypothetical protein
MVNVSWICSCESGGGAVYCKSLSAPLVASSEPEGLCRECQLIILIGIADQRGQGHGLRAGQLDGMALATDEARCRILRQGGRAGKCRSANCSPRADLKHAARRCRNTVDSERNHGGSALPGARPVGPGDLNTTPDDLGPELRSGGLSSDSHAADRARGWIHEHKRSQIEVQRPSLILRNIQRDDGFGRGDGLRPSVGCRTPEQKETGEPGHTHCRTRNVETFHLVHPAHRMFVTSLGDCQ